MNSTVRKLRKKRVSIESGLLDALDPMSANDGVIPGGEILTAFLNAKPSRRTQQVEALIAGSQRAAELMDQIERSSVPEAKQGAEREVNKLLMILNGFLSDYKWQPVILGSRQRGSHFVVRLTIRSKPGDTALALEHYAVQWILDHLFVVPRIRRCRLSSCQKWFCAKTDHQKYCGGNCRQQDASQGESFKRKRRVYMKQYRSDQKEREMREKRAFKGRGK